VHFVPVTASELTVVEARSVMTSRCSLETPIECGKANVEVTAMRMLMRADVCILNCFLFRSDKVIW
jgi:hypothetical protein